MPVPKRKRSKARRDSRFANKGMEVQSISGCLNCKSPIGSHQVCKECGFYKGIKVMRTKMDRTMTRVETRQAKTARQQQQSTAQDESQ